MTQLLRPFLLVALHTVLLASFAPQAVAFCQLTGAIGYALSSSELQLASIPPEQPHEQQQASPEYQHIHRMLRSYKLLMFMNGSQARPGCEQSDDAAKCLERVCGAGTIRKNGSMRDENLFQMMDVTSDEKIRKGLQEYNPNWDVAIPQLYAKGEFIGGSDTMYEMFYNGDFKRLVDDLEA
jgi:monothiol glutaredoxin